MELLEIFLNFLALTYTVNDLSALNKI